MAEKLFLIDGSALYYRSYFALIRNPLINSKGENTSATYGFLNALLKIIEDEKPDYLAIIFDTKEPTFRHALYKEYKATREKMPEEMSQQYPRLVSTLKSFNFTLLELPGYEADDIIGTIATKYASPERNVYIVSGDKDMAQLVAHNIVLYTPGKNNQPPEIIDSKMVKEKYGVRPEQIIDWLTLMGDNSDNIPGAEKVGKVTAAKLLDEYGTLEHIFENLDRIKSPSLKQNLKNFLEQSRLSKQLTTIDLETPVKIDLNGLKFKLWEMDVVDPILRDLEFRRFYDRMLAISRSSTPSEEYTQQDADTNIRYILVKDIEHVREIAASLKNEKCFVFDLETDSLDTHIADIAGIAISWKENTAYYIPVTHPDIALDKKEVAKILGPVFGDPGIKKDGQNIKFDAAILKHHGMPVAGISFDTMIASYLIDPSGRQHNLDRLASEYLNYRMIPIEDVIGSGRNQKVMTDIPASEVTPYAAEDADITLKLKHIFQEKLRENNLEKLFHDLEMPLVEVLMEMEENGIKIDLELLKDLSKKLEISINELEHQIFEEAGSTFNINSPQQLGRILFEDLEIHIQLEKRKPQKTKTGQYSTSENVLERYIQHPLIEDILNYRSLTKLKNTYIDALPELISPVTGKIHTSFNQTVAATGRLSSSNPNLQNIPIRTELGREIRKAFIASQEGYSILSADYSQIELRIMAHLSGDKKLIEAFMNNQDIHASTASLIFSLPIGEVTSDHRRKAKEINFGIMYGMNEYGLSNRLHITVEEARTFINGYFATYPSIQKFMTTTIRQATDKGYVETMLNRRRYLPEIRSTNRNVREFGERTAINTPIQGSAADLIKMAMIDIHRYITEKTIAARMLLQVHDELVFEVENRIMEDFAKNIKSIMENAIPLSVPVLVETGSGKDWLEAHQ